MRCPSHPSSWELFNTTMQNPSAYEQYLYNIWVNTVPTATQPGGCNFGRHHAHDSFQRLLSLRCTLGCCHLNCASTSVLPFTHSSDPGDRTAFWPRSPDFTFLYFSGVYFLCVSAGEPHPQHLQSDRTAENYCLYCLAAAQENKYWSQAWNEPFCFGI